MNHAAATEEARNNFEAAVLIFTPPLSAKVQMLLSFKEGIMELRRKGASREDFCRGWLITGDTARVKPAPGSPPCCTKCSRTNRTGWPLH